VRAHGIEHACLVRGEARWAQRVRELIQRVELCGVDVDALPSANQRGVAAWHAGGETNEGYQDDLGAKVHNFDMSPAYAIELVREAQAFAALGALFREYQAHINVDLCFQDFEAELAAIDRIYTAPRGAAFLARAAVAGQALALGCVALKELVPGCCEMKRLYVRPQYQRAGIGRALVAACMDRARELGYASMRLDTLASMPAAQALYRGLGFVDINAYYHNPHPATRFMECRF
jgi:putative acetyltransferase